MASHSVAVAKHATLVGTTADTVTLTQGFGQVEVLNRGGTATCYITYGSDPATPTAGADNSLALPPGTAVTLDGNERGGFVVKIVGDGNEYSVQGVDQ